jgi:hypothetical protein
MGRNRKKNRHLPPRVYLRRGKLYYVQPGTQKWIPLKEGLKTWAAIVEAADAGPQSDMRTLWVSYDLILPQKFGGPSKLEGQLELHWAEIAQGGM